MVTEAETEELEEDPEMIEEDLEDEVEREVLTEVAVDLSQETAAKTSGTLATAGLVTGANLSIARTTAATDKAAADTAVVAGAKAKEEVEATVLHSALSNGNLRLHQASQCLSR